MTIPQRQRRPTSSYAVGRSTSSSIDGARPVRMAKSSRIENGSEYSRIDLRKYHAASAAMRRSDFFSPVCVVQIGALMSDVYGDCGEWKSFVSHPFRVVCLPGMTPAMIGIGSFFSSETSYDGRELIS